MNNYTKRALKDLVELRKEVESAYSYLERDMEDVDQLIENVTNSIEDLDSDYSDLEAELKNKEHALDNTYMQLEEAEEKIEEMEGSWFLPVSMEDEMKITLLKGLFKKYTLLQLEEIEKQIVI